MANSCWHIYNYHLELLLLLQRRGYDMVVVAPVDKYIQYLNRAGLVKHYPLRHLLAHTRNPWQEAKLFLEIFQLLRRLRPDVILSYTIKPNLYGSLAARLLRIPIIPTLTGLGYTFVHPQGINRLIPSLYRIAFRGVPAVVFQNEGDRDLFLQQQLIQPSQARLIAGSGIDLQHFSYRPLPVDTQPFVFLYLGRLLADKGLRELVTAAAEVRKTHPQVEVWLAGDLQTDYPASIREEELLAWIESGWVRYWGHRNDVRPLLDKAQVLVLPSYREGLSRALLEGMASGRPLITTDVPGCRDTVQANENGVLVPPQNAEALALAMAYLVELPLDTLRTMGVRSRELAQERFSMILVKKAYLQLIDQVLQTTRKGESKSSSQPH